MCGCGLAIGELLNWTYCHLSVCIIMCWIKVIGHSWVGICLRRGRWERGRWIELVESLSRNPCALFLAEKAGKEVGEGFGGAATSFSSFPLRHTTSFPPAPPPLPDVWPLPTLPVHERMLLMRQQSGPWFFPPVPHCFSLPFLVFIV